jgi:hypothetical protein
MIGNDVGSTRNSRRKRQQTELTPAEKWEKPFSDLAENQRKWLDALRLFPSPRGSKADAIYDSLFHEREMARLSDRSSAPGYAQLARRALALNLEPSACSMDKEDVKQRFIRSYQRRKKVLRLPDPS